MIDSKTIGPQVQELQLILHDLIAEDMVVNEAFEVATIIEKLPPSWNDFKNYLKHKLKEMKLEDLVIQLKLRKITKTPKRKDPTKDKKRKKSSVQKLEQAKKKFKGKCYNCCKVGNRSFDFRASREEKEKGKGKSQANTVEKEGRCRDLCAIISECNLVGNPKEWFLDSGATRHIFSTKEAFATMDEAIDVFKQYKNEVENQLSLKIKMIRSDRGGEYQSPFAEIVLKYGIIHQTTAPYTPQTNGLEERSNITLKEMMNALMINSSSP
ncbi:uncharacterized protein [Solanum lycopersicum]|uniref:uncharacterized protein n=1 Tax=Solanum lycopersicum TaxID=4081 RepID=UPI00374961F7